MANEGVESDSYRKEWDSKQVYILAGICLVLGTALGYLFRGSEISTNPPPASSQSQTPGQTGMPQQMPSLDQLKQMADKRAEPLLAQLQKDPNNADVLKQLARIYEATHQFKQASDYYRKAAEINPKDVAARTSMASCLYYSGDVDGALAQLQQALKVDPKDANSLFNLGIIRWKGKNDTQGALQAWDQLLKSNPNLESSKKAQVEKLIAEAKQGPAS